MALSPSKAQYLSLKEEDLEAYFGKNTSSYTRYWRFVTNQNQSGTKFGIGWHWPAFFIGFVWFFYRRLYLEGFIILIGTLFFGFLLDVFFPNIQVPNVIFGIFFASLAKPLALRRAYKKITQIDGLSLDEYQRKKQLENLGGTSYVGLAVGLLLLAAFAVILFLGMQY